MRALLVLMVMWASPVWAVSCENLEHAGRSYTACTVDPTSEDLRLFLRDGDENVLGNFMNIDAALDAGKLVFGMNAGMYHDDRRPVGHYIQDGREQMRVISNAGPGNFGLLPNGVFCITDDSAMVYETLAYIDQSPDCRDATQSGPMLVIDGALHPRFLAESTSRYIRNGVGTSASGDLAVFVISNEPVTFHEFGTLYKDALGLPNALYFDGNVSRLYAPELNRADLGFRLGPIVGVVE